MTQPAVFGAAFYTGPTYSAGGVPAVYGQGVYGRSVYGLVDLPPDLHMWRIRPLDTGWTITRTPAVNTA